MPYTHPNRVGEQFGGLFEHAASSLEGLYNDASCVQLFLLPDQEAQLVISHALVISQLDYCNVLNMGLTLKNIQKLQLVQNMGSYLCELHWFSVGTIVPTIVPTKAQF